MVFFLTCCQDWNYSTYFCLSDSTLSKQLWYALGPALDLGSLREAVALKIAKCREFLCAPAHRMDSSCAGRAPVLVIPPAAPLRGGREGPSVIWNECRTSHAHHQHHSVNVAVKATGSLLATCKRAGPVPDSRGVLSH